MAGRFKRRSQGNQDMVLQITSMADIFTIILVFLLKSLSTGASTVSSSQDLMLPEVKKGEAQLQESVKLEVSEKNISVEEKPVVTLQKYMFLQADLEFDGTPKALTTVLTAIRKRNTLQQFPRLMVFADKGTPYGTMRAILASASESGYAEFKLVVVEDQ